jgi:hypothetical protein
MAFSATKIKTDIQGTTKVEYWTWSAASVTGGTITTGFSKILAINPNNNVTEDQGLWVPNGGVITLTGVTSNDTGILEVKGC